MSSDSSKNDIIRIFLGTYTNSSSQGVYEIYLDRTEERLIGQAKLIIPSTNPTYIARTPQGHLCVGVREEKPQKISGPALYAFDTDNDEWKQTDAIRHDGSSVCHLYVDNSYGHLIFGSSYGDGKLRVYEYGPQTGSLTTIQEIIRSRDTTKRSFPHENQADGNHVHYTELTPDGRFLAVCDLGEDSVIFYSLDRVHQEEQLHHHEEHRKPQQIRLQEHFVQYFRAGAGPRHMVFHSSGNYAYVVGELDSTLNIIKYDAQKGTSSFVQRISTLPDDFIEWSSCAAIRISPDDKFVYISNRGHHSIAIFALAQDGGKATLVDIVQTDSFPRDFNIDPSGKFIICGHQLSDYLMLFKRNQETGKLTLIQDQVPAPECVCICFDQ